MKRITGTLALAALVALASVALAADAKKPEKMEPKSMTMKGEIVDVGCYMGHGASGEKHKDCGLKCVAGGMPMGLLTADGALYILTPSMSAGDTFAKCKDWVSEQVEVTGMVHDHKGTKTLEVSAAKPAGAMSDAKAGK